MRSLAIYALLASAADVATAGPVQARKASEGQSGLDRLDNLIRSFQSQEIGGGSSGLRPVEGSNTTISRIITPTLRTPGSAQSSQPPVLETSSLPLPALETSSLLRSSKSSARGALPTPEPSAAPIASTEQRTLSTPANSSTSSERSAGSTPSQRLPSTSSVESFSRLPDPNSQPLRLSFITVTASAKERASTVTKTEQASTVTHTVIGTGLKETVTVTHSANASTVTVSVTIPASVVSAAPPASHVQAPSSSPSVIEAKPNKDGNGVGVSVISIFSPSIPAPAQPPPTSSSVPPPASAAPPPPPPPQSSSSALPPPPPPAAEINQPVPSPSSAAPSSVAPPSAAPPSPSSATTSSASPTVSSSTTSSSSSQISAAVPSAESPTASPEPAASATTSVSKSTAASSAVTTPDKSAPLESAVQGQPTVISSTSKVTAAKPAASIPPPLPIDLSGFTLSSQLELGNLMVPATAAGPAASVVLT